MSVEITYSNVKNILTRTTGYLRRVTSHSLQPYRGCSFGNALCGTGCYVKHNHHVLKGRAWGGFLEVRSNAPDSYLANRDREAGWAHRNRERFSIFCSSATDPFVPQEWRYGVTRGVLEAMLREPPDQLVLQTHSHRLVGYGDLFMELALRCDFRIHLSIETDCDRIPGLPPHASPIESRFEAIAMLRNAGLKTVVTVAPLLPIDKPEKFFARIAEVADAVVIDHFIEGDGSPNGSRTWRTPLPAAMEAYCPDSVTLEYRQRMVSVARRHMPGRVGINIDGFSGLYS